MPVDQDKEFKLISVTVDEDDDVVFQAGTKLQVETAAAAEGSRVEAETIAAGVASEAADSSLASFSSTSAAASVPNPCPKQPYTFQEMQTTEEDLHAEVPFSTMHKTIVAVFILFLVAAILYWFFLR